MVKTYFGAQFLRTKFSALSGETVIAYTEQNVSSSHPFSIKVSKQGMWFEGVLEKKIASERELQDFAKMISDVWQDARTLAPKIVAPTGPINV